MAGLCLPCLIHIQIAYTSAAMILVLAEASMTQGIRGQLEQHMRKVDLPLQHVRVVNDVLGQFVFTTGKKRHLDKNKLDACAATLARLIAQYQPRTIIINDPNVLEYVTGHYRSLDLLRGSVYFINDIPAIVIDSLRTAGAGSKLHSVPYAAFILRQDLKKVKRWYTGTIQNEPRFNYRVCDSVGELQTFIDCAERSHLISMDIETAGTGQNTIITCCGYAMLQGDGNIISWVVPLFSPADVQGNSWREADYHTVIGAMRRVHTCDAPKVMQNGAYDCFHLLRYHLPPRNYFLDTAVAFQSLWCELPKRLDFIASIACDRYRYWKGERSSADAKDDVKGGTVPVGTATEWNRYLRYNALDAHYTLLSMLWLMRIIANVDWALANYSMRMAHFVGPALRMTLSGVRVNEKLRELFMQRNLIDSEQALETLRIMTADPEFNPNSPQQVASLVYGILRAVPIDKNNPQSINERILQIVQTQHPLTNRIINQIWAVKKPRNNIAKYGPPHRTEARNNKWRGLQLINSRWLYAMNPIGTETERYSSGNSPLWVGTSIQNVPYGVREMIEPDPGYVMFDFDYAKADLWHTAFASEEKNMMKLLLDEVAGRIDVHCHHAAQFFSQPYGKVYAGYKNKEPWVVDSLRGIRQNAKRIVYGANYLMAGHTLFVTMGKVAVDATAQAMGHDTHAWSVKQYGMFCQSLLDFYFTKMYPGLLPWLERAINRAVRSGNRVTVCGGNSRTFFANLQRDKAAQRELAAFFGQGGTGRMINRAIYRLFYTDPIIAPAWQRGDIMILFQVHDSIVGQVRETHLHLLKHFKEAMEVQNTINDRTFVVPAEGNVGYGWGHRMCPWHSAITLDDIRKADNAWREKHVNE